MLDVISKADYFAALDDADLNQKLRAVSRDNWGMKHVQDAWVLSKLIGVTGKSILEVGGGHTRLMRCLDASNRMVNLDKLEGLDGGPKAPPPVVGVENVVANLGDFHPDVKDGSFDYVVSISVMEHIPATAYPAYWEDHARVLKRGGAGIHAIDVYITDEQDDAVEARLSMYLDTLTASGLRLSERSALPRPLTFQSSYASCADYCMWMWNNQAPSLKPRRSTHQCVSLKLVVTR